MNQAKRLSSGVLLGCLLFCNLCSVNAQSDLQNNEVKQSPVYSSAYRTTQAAQPQLTQQPEHWPNVAELLNQISLQQPLSHIAVRPGTSQLASAGAASHIVVWDMQTAVELRHFGVVNQPQAAAISAVQYSGDGSWLLAGDSAGSVSLWAAESGQLKWRFSADSIADATAGQSRIAPVHSGSVNALAFAPQNAIKGGRQPWFASASEDGTVHIRALHSGELLRVIRVQRSWITDMDISADGHWLIAATENGALQLFAVDDIFRTAANVPVKRLRLSGHSSYIYDLAISADSQWLATAGYQEPIKLWSLAALQLNAKKRSTGHVDLLPLQLDADSEAGATSLVFSNDAQQLYAGYSDSSVRSWQVADLTLLQEQMISDSDVVDLALVPATGQLAVAHWQGDISLVSADSLQSVRRLKPQRRPYTAMLTNRTSDWLLSVDNKGGLQFWDMAQRRLQHSLPPTGQAVSQLSMSPDELSFAVLADDGRLWHHNAPAANACLTPDNAELAEIESAPSLQQLALAEPVTAISYSADSQQLILALSDSIAFLPQRLVGRDLQTSSPIPLVDANKALTGFTNPVMLLAVSDDGEWLAAGLEDHSVLLWHLPSRRLRRHWQVHASELSALRFLPSGELLSADYSGAVLRWQTGSDLPLSERQLEHSADALAFNAELNQLLVVSAGLQPRSEATLSLYSWPSLTLLATLQNQDNQTALLPLAAGDWLMSSVQSQLTQLSLVDGQLQPAALLISGRDGNWLSCKQLAQQPACIRGDNGRFLLQADTQGRLSWLSPQANAATPQ